MRTIAIGVTGLLVAGVLSGCCCCGGGCGSCAGSPIPYSDGNPYECGSGTFWGVGYYCQQYGFLRRRDPYPCYIPCADGSYDPASEQNPAPAQNPTTPVPATPAPYDSDLEAPVVPPPAP